MQSTSSNDVLDILKKCAQLKKFVLDFEGDKAPNLSMGIVELPKLERLCVSSNRTIGRFIGHIVAPALLYLTISYDISFAITPEETWLPVDTLLAILRSCRRLWSLSLFNVSMSGHDLVACLQATPHLVDLSFPSSAYHTNLVTNVLVDALTCIPSSNAVLLLPQLEQLYFALSGNEQPTEEKILRMLESRYPEDETTVTCLEEVTLVFGDSVGMHQRGWDWLDELSDMGLNITLHTQGPTENEDGCGRYVIPD